MWRGKFDREIEDKEDLITAASQLRHVLWLAQKATPQRAVHFRGLR